VQAAQVTGRGGSHGVLTAEEHVQAAQVIGRGGSHGLLTAQEHVQAAQVRPLETPQKPCLNSWQGSAKLSPLSPLPQPSEFCTDEKNSLIRSAMDALRYSKK